MTSRPNLYLAVLTACALALLPFDAFAQGSDCVYSPDGLQVSYDLNRMSKEGSGDHEIYGGDIPCTDEKEDNYTYYYNFCRPINLPQSHVPACNLLGDVAVLQKSIDGTCKIAGKVKTQKIELIDPNHPADGVKVTYSGGDSCHTQDKERKTTIYARCSHEGVAWREDLVDEPKGAKSCEYEIKLHSFKACPTECPLGDNSKPCGGGGHCAYDHTSKKARCFCNTGKGGKACTEDIKEQQTVNGVMMGLLVTVLIFTLLLGGVLGFLIYKIREARGETSSYMKVQGQEMMLKSNI